ncbi:MAG: hydrogenase nickel incorporation protein HypB [Alphaproteobacteria bacterium]
MCGVCGCGHGEVSIEDVKDEKHKHEHHHGHSHDVSSSRLLEIEQDILAKNNHTAAHNRQHFKADNILALNFVSSPGSGKTTLLVETIKRLKEKASIVVIEGDQQTDNDAQRIRQTGVASLQINTGRGCHLDADMIHQAMHKIEAPTGGYLFIENVGNLVCPAGFDLGEAHKIVVISTTEGEDKPLKYPHMFAASSLMIINKNDLTPHLNIDIESLKNNARKINPHIAILCLSAQTGEGMDEWLKWLEAAKIMAQMSD